LIYIVRGDFYIIFFLTSFSALWRESGAQKTLETEERLVKARRRECQTPLLLPPPIGIGPRVRSTVVVGA
jgi:hypothetical protein